MPRKDGDFFVEDFFDNVGGLNTADSPFLVANNQARGGKNFDYVLKGAIRRRFGYQKVNSTPFTQTAAYGLSLWDTSSDDSEVIRAAGRKLEVIDLAAKTATSLTEDTSTAGSDIINTSNTDPVLFAQFNSASNDVLWCAGRGVPHVYGVYSDSKVTRNGAEAPTASSFSATGTGTGSAITLGAGSYRYALALRKASTGITSNVAEMEAQVDVLETNDYVALSWSLDSLDTTKYDKILIYRSSAGGSEGFTAGALVAMVDSTETSYEDTGGALDSSTTIPRERNITDHSSLPSGPFSAITVFKRRLVVAKGSSLYFSDLNNPEYFPAVNKITLPSGGSITALGVISFTSPGSSEVDEILCIFKNRECWVVTGNSIDDWVLKWIDSTGCKTQATIVSANGYLAWIDDRGIYLWDGVNKPAYCSQFIEDIFGQYGRLDKTSIEKCFGIFFRKANQIIWYLSSKDADDHKFQIKMDLRLTIPSSMNTAGQRMIPGIFSFDETSVPLKAAASVVPPGQSEEQVLAVDDAGFIYYGFTDFTDGGNAYTFQYDTRDLDMGTPGVNKNFNKVVVWVEDFGTWPLTLKFAVNHKVADTDFTSAELELTDNPAGDNSAVWGVGRWGDFDFTYYNKKIRPLVFNLRSANNNIQGDSIKLRFEQDDSDAPVTIYGFSVYFSLLPSRVK